MKKRFLAILLTLVMVMALTVPAFAAGTKEVVVDEVHGVTITMDEFLRVETHRYAFGDYGSGFTYDTYKTLTFYVVADNSTVTIEAMEGRRYAEEGEAWWENGSQSDFAYRFWSSYNWYGEFNAFGDRSGTEVEALTGPDIRTMTPSKWIYLDGSYSIYFMCESDFAKLVPVDEEPTAPTEPEKPALPTKFKDIKAGKFYTDAVIWAVDEGITDGVSKTKFAPSQKCSQKEIITFLWRAMEEPGADTAPIKVSKSYQKAINWAYAQGMIDETFQADQLCTRADAVTYIWKALDSKGVTEAKSFKDVPADAPYADAVSWAVANGVTEGTSKTKFSPDQVCNRGQIVTFLYRAFK